MNTVYFVREVPSGGLEKVVNSVFMQFLYSSSLAKQQIKSKNRTSCDQNIVYTTTGRHKR